MTLPKLSVPPGLNRTGTEYESAGRYWASDLVRWVSGRLRVIGGWVALSTGLTGTARAAHTWYDNNVVGRVAVGTESKLYVVTTAGARTDITPVGYTSQDSGSSTWVLDNAGQLLIGCNDEEGIIYTWTPGAGAAATLTNAPTAYGVAVTNEGIPVALGSAGNPRQVSWPDRDDYTDWTAGPTDLAGDLIIQAQGTIQNAKKIRAGLLIWTTGDLHLMRFLGLPDVYGITPVSDNCGAVSRHCMVLVGDIARWMGPDSFYVCNGGSFVQKMPCEVREDVFGANTNADGNRTLGMNKASAHKVRGVHVSQFNEIWWHYPKGPATENNATVVYNYLEDTWALHDMVRTCGVEEGNGFTSPLMVGGTTLWTHESGDSRSGVGTPYARSGPVEIGDGESVSHVSRVVPDEGTVGDVDVYFYTRPFPNGTEVEHGPFSSANPINVRLMGRQVAMKFEESSASDWRVGTYRVELSAGGKRSSG